MSGSEHDVLDVLIERAREDKPDLASLDAMRRALGVGEASVGPKTPSGVAVVKLALGALVVGGIAIAVLMYSGDRPPAPAMQTTEALDASEAEESAPDTMPLEVATPRAPTPLAPPHQEPHHEPRRARRIEPREPESVAIAPAPNEAEAEILFRVRRALSRADFESAQQGLIRHRELYPSGRLLEERESLDIELAIRKGQTDRARAMLERFGRDRPRSVHRERLDRLLTREPRATADSPNPE